MLVAFDLDGVLLDSKECMAQTWAEVNEHFKLNTDFELYFNLIGRPFTDILTMLDIKDRHDQIKEAYFTISRSNIGLTRLYPDVMEVLTFMKEVQDYKLALVTSKSYASTMTIVGKYNLPVDHVITPDLKMTIDDSVVSLEGKPSPAPLFAAMILSGRGTGETSYIGDMSTDQECADAAGVTYYHADWGYGEPAYSNATRFANMKALGGYL